MGIKVNSLIDAVKILAFKVLTSPQVDNHSNKGIRDNMGIKVNSLLDAVKILVLKTHKSTNW